MPLINNIVISSIINIIVNGYGMFHRMNTSLKGRLSERTFHYATKLMFSMKYPFSETSFRQSVHLVKWLWRNVILRN